MQRLLCVVGAPVLLVAAFTVIFLSARSHERAAYQAIPSSFTIEIAGKTILITVADTEEERMRGLSGKERLHENEGMLFVFTSESRYGFWMKDMRFPIDIIWLSVDGTIVDMHADLSPSTYPEIFRPREPVRYVLELPAGFAELNSLETGDRIELERRVF